MKPRDDAIQKTAENLNLKELMTHLDKNGKPTDVDSKTRKDYQAMYDQNNKKSQIGKNGINTGNNNIVLIPENFQYIILIANIRQPVRDMVDAVSANNAHPSWMAKEYRVETTKDSAWYAEKDIQNKFRKTHPTTSNNFDAKQFACVSIVEYFPNSLERMAMSKISNDQRIDLACDVGQQISGMLGELEKSGCIWTDLKTGNIMLRDDNSIGISDIKAFFPVDKTLVTEESPYDRVLAKNDDDFNQKARDLTQDQFLIKAFDSPDEPLKFAVKGNDGKLIEGTISQEMLKSKFGNDTKKFETFKNKLSGERPSMVYEDLKKIYDISAAENGTRAARYSPRFIDVSPAFASGARRVAEAKYNSPEQARDAAREIWQKEYSYQLAAALYITLTGSDKEFNPEKPAVFNFNQEVFTATEDGKKLQSVIEKLSAENPAERMLYNDAMNELAKIRPPVQRVQAEPEPVEQTVTKAKSLRESFKKTMSKSHIPKKITPEPKSEPKVEFKEPEITPEKTEEAVSKSKSRAGLLKRTVSKSLMPKISTEQAKREREQEMIGKFDKPKQNELLTRKKSVKELKKSDHIEPVKPRMK